jgi:hydroxyacylglutathione hydrolase
MEYKRLMTDMFSSNCYIIGDKDEGVVIDPCADSSEILEAAEKLGLNIKYIILTHSHIDHICSVDDLRDKTGARVLVHKDDAAALGDARFNGSALFGLAKAFKSADMLLNDGDTIKAGNLELQIIHTPGHTPGGICIKVEEKLFTGDTLFKMSIGRTDLGNGDYDDIIASIKEKLMTLDDETIVYPGHGSASTIGYEKKNNPYI